MVDRSVDFLDVGCGFGGLTGWSRAAASWCEDAQAEGGGACSEAGGAVPGQADAGAGDPRQGDGYAYLLAPGGILYTITDVEELHEWHVDKCSSHPCFTRIPDSELVRCCLNALLLTRMDFKLTRLSFQASDPCVKAMTEETEEGKKVARGGGKKYVAVFRRKANEDVAVDNLFW
ncbi:unnamed protein product [Phytophthora fragariaefolia]|uniref:tRNA (guanine(46)-N(7))-methyltransferase n=1 Tax=Phytophthora fragariaefolia TaxID=1490495 RepID=A0A9W7CZ55_9STRA|nr:unnamed protein product [Phytophthora fragariaefolia]